ncbi:MAG: DUF4012 domain-containing protein [bacterium]|nr:DUF4012 domain-containing protein [bacterium]
MSSGFVTQLVSDLPTVVIITDTSVIVEELERQLGILGLSVVVIPLHDLEKQQTQLENREVYKTLCWLTKPSELTTSSREQLITFLRTRPELVLLALHWLPELTTTAAEFSLWSQHSAAQAQLLLYLQSTLPEARFALCKDVAPEVFASYLPLRLGLAGFSRGVLFDPQVTWRWQTVSQVSRVLARVLTRPDASNSVIEGVAMESGTLWEKLQAAYGISTQVKLRIDTRHTTSASGLPEGFKSIKTEGIALQEIVTNITAFLSTKRAQASLPTENVTNLPTPEKQQTDVSKPQAQSQPVVVPVLPPVEFASEHQLEQEKVAASASVAPESKAEITDETESALGDDDDATLEEATQRIFKEYRLVQKKDHVTTMVKDTTSVTKKTRHKRKLFWGGVAFSTLALLVSVLAVSYFVAWSMFKGSLDEWLASFTLAPTAQAVDMSSIQPWKSVVESEIKLYSLIVDESIFAQPLAVLSVIDDVVALQAQMAEISLLGQQAYAEVTSTQTGDILSTYAELASKSQTSYEQLSVIQAKIKQIEPSVFPEATQKRLKELEQSLNTYKQALLVPQQLQPLLPVLLASEGKRTYAVLFQNNQELRPSGGFIQSVALITVDKGSIIDTQAWSVYDLDSRFSGVVEPPADLKQHLGEQQWFLRDSNWSPDFPTAGRQAAFFIEKATGNRVDGVIGLHLGVMEQLIKVTGPIELPEYNEVLTDKNLSERMEFHSEVQLVATGTPDYSTVVLNKLLQKLQTTSGEKTTSIQTVLQTALAEHQVTFTLIDPDENVSLQTLGWTGSLLSPSCPAQLKSANCFVDTIAQSEANVGINKANIYVSRDTRHSVRLSPTQATHSRTVTFNNKSSSVAWPKGPYKNYLRWYVPSSATVKTVAINGRLLSPEQITQFTDQGRRVVGVNVEVPIKQQVIVEFAYSVPFSPADSAGYALFSQLQPGLIESTQAATITVDDKSKPSLIAPQATLSGNVITFEPTSDTHSFVGVSF